VQFNTLDLLIAMFLRQKSSHHRYLSSQKKCVLNYQLLFYADDHIKLVVFGIRGSERVSVYGEHEINYGYHCLDF
jgi:hypothetical protein